MARITSILLTLVAVAALGTSDAAWAQERMDRQFINPPGIFKHPAFTRVVTVKGPMKIVFVAGQTPSDMNYKPVAPGDYRAQYVKVMENLDLQLKAAGATEVYLFGSAAAGTARETSDIDLAVRGIPPERFFRAHSDASDALDCPFDLVELDEPSPLTRHLEREGLLRRVG